METAAREVTLTIGKLVPVAAIACLFVRTLTSTNVLAQPPSSRPSDILETVAQKNGLAGVKEPWHLRTKYEIFAYDGSPQDSGIYEEFWVSPKQYKRIYKGTKFNQVDIATGRLLYRIGDRDWPGLRESQVRTLVTQPVPQDLDVNGFDLEVVTRSFEASQLPCVVLNSRRVSNVRVVVVGQPILSAHYCFERNTPILRFSSQGAGHDDILFNNLTMFKEQYLAREISLTNAKERLLLSVEMIEELAAVNSTDFVPPADAIGPLGAEGSVSVKSSALTTLKRPFPVYPDAARRKRIQGTVVLQTTIGKDGLVKNIQVVDGRSELRQAAIQSLQQWQFRPFLILGEPAQVSTQIEIGFTLN